MPELKLVIGNKAYSSWSLRPWFLMKHADIAFEEIRIPLYEGDFAARIAAYSPAGKVPVLVAAGTSIWDSLAICEYLAELFPEKALWPSARAPRAYARSISAEMHAGFAALRAQMGMNVRRTFAGVGRTPAVLADIERIVAIWSECLQRYGGPYLFGAFTVADAMYAPVATRFSTYAVSLPALAQRYADTLLSHPAMVEWYRAARAETEVLPQYEHEGRA